jgi:DNA polymerase III sliding clamp (beta) subunit (PCNA family)
MQDFRSAVEAAASIAPAKSSIAILSHIYLSPDFIAATDLDISLRRELRGEGPRFTPACVSAKMLKSVIAGFSGGDIEVERDGPDLRFTSSGGETAAIRSLEGDDFPQAAEPREGEKVTFPAATFAQIYKSVSHCISEENRFGAPGAKIEADGKMLTAFATDGHRAAIEGIAMAGKVETCVVSLPGLKALANLPGDVHVLCDGEHLSAQAGLASLSVRLLEKQLPDPAQFLGKKAEKCLAMNRSALIAGLRKLQPMADQEAVAFTFTMADEEITLEFSNNKHGSISLKCEAAASGDDATFKANLTYVLDSLDSMDCERVELSGTEKFGSTAIFARPEGANNDSSLRLFVPLWK